MIDTLAKRAATSRYALGGSGIRPPSGTFTQIERGYTLGLYTFTYVAVNAPVWTITFIGTEQTSGELAATSATGSLFVTTATAELAVSELAIA